MKIDEKMLARLELAHEEVGRVINMIKVGQKQVVQVDDKVIRDQIDLLSLLLEKKGVETQKDKTHKRLIDLLQATSKLDYLENIKEVEDEFAENLR